MRYTDPSGHVFLTILAGALIGAAVGAGVEFVSQKVVEKKKEVDWKAVGYEAAVGAVGGAIGGIFGKVGGSVIGSAKNGVAKLIAKQVVKAGVSEAAGGFLEDAGRQMIVEGKSINKLDVGRLFRTAGIAGLMGMFGSMLGILQDLRSDYRMETVTKTVTQVKTVNKCKNNRIDCPNHPNYPVIVDRYQEVVTVPELVYVGKEGAENAAKGAAGRLDDDVAGMVARKESPLDPVKGWFQESAGKKEEYSFKSKINIKNLSILSGTFTAKDVPLIKNGDFNKFFNSLTVDELDILWSNKEIRNVIEARLRSPGGFHEWHLVSRTPQFKYWGVSAEQIRDLRSPIKSVKFINPNGIHGGRGSTTAHNELLKIIDTSNDYRTFIRRLNNWANYRLENGIDMLPDGLKNIIKWR